MFFAGDHVNVVKGMQNIKLTVKPVIEAKCFLKVFKQLCIVAGHRKIIERKRGMNTNSAGVRLPKAGQEFLPVLLTPIFVKDLYADILRQSQQALYLELYKAAGTNTIFHLTRSVPCMKIRFTSAVTCGRNKNSSVITNSRMQTGRLKNTSTSP